MKPAQGKRNLTPGRGSGTVALSGKAEVMRIRRFPATVIAAATIALWVSFTTSVVAQEFSTPNTTSGAPATERIQLSSGAEDVLKLSHAKINDDITVAFIQNGNRGYNLTANEIV